jgi:hypothetical protein
MEKVLLSLLSAIVGFALSQSFNLVNFLRRPRFRVKEWTDGVLSSYTGNPPETPWEIELGFYLENSGINPAKNIRVFISDFKISTNSEIEPELTSIDFLELERPVDILPAEECVAIKLGVMKSDSREIHLNLHKTPTESQLGLIGADTRDAVRLEVKFLMICDNQNTFQCMIFKFRPDLNEWSSNLLQDYTQ